MRVQYQQVYFSKSITDCCVLFLYTLFSHGLLLLNDGVYWDDWILYIDLIRDNWTSLQQFDRELGGLPVGYWLTSLIGYFPNTVLMFKMVFFCSIFSAGFLVYLIFDELKLKNHAQQLFVSLVVISYPAFKMTISMAAGAYWVWYAVFLLGCYSALKGLNASGYSRYYLRVLSYAIFAIAFRANSFLVFYFGFLFLLVFYEKGRIRHFNTIFMIQRVIIRYADYLCFPFIYFIVIKKLFPSTGIYSTYNSLFADFTIRKYVGCYYYYIINAVYAQFRDGFIWLAKYPLLSVGFTLLVYILYLFNFQDCRFTPERNIKSRSFFLFGCLLLFLAAFPYAAVLKFPSETGTDTRHSLLSGLPVGIILFSVFCNKYGTIRKSGALVLSMFLVLMSFSCIKNYLFWQMHWIKDKSTMYHLSKTKYEDVSIFWIQDEFVIPETEPWHQYYAYASMFRYVWGGDSRIGLDIRDKSFYSRWMHAEGKQFFRIERYNVAGFNPNGRQASFSIREGPLVTEFGFWRICLRYWYYIYFSRGKLDDLLSGCTKIEFGKI